MADQSQQPDQELERLLRRALKTPPISNEEIERRSKEEKRGRTTPKE